MIYKCGVMSVAGPRELLSANWWRRGSLASYFIAFIISDLTFLLV